MSGEYVLDPNEAEGSVDWSTHWSMVVVNVILLHSTVNHRQQQQVLSWTNVISHVGGPVLSRHPNHVISLWT